MSALGFRVELQKLINRESRENCSDTPDYILAEYLARCLAAFDHAVQYRERHYGRTCGSEKTTVETSPGLDPTQNRREIAGKQAYLDSQYPDARYPRWHELTQEQRDEWIDRAAANRREAL